MTYMDTIHAAAIEDDARRCASCGRRHFHTEDCHTSGACNVCGFAEAAHAGLMSDLETVRGVVVGPCLTYTKESR